MADRTVTDMAGRTWTCASAADTGGELRRGRDVIISCTTPSVKAPVNVTVGWQWEKMAPAGLARLISLSSPVPRG